MPLQWRVILIEHSPPGGQIRFALRFFDGLERRLADISSSNLAYAHRHMARDIFVEQLKQMFRICFDTRRWIEELGSVDLTIGTRTHGNMTVIAAFSPGVLVVHDACVTAEEMHVPCTDGKSVIDEADYRHALKYVEFDAAFDMIRRRKADMLVDVFANLGVPASDHLRYLAA